MPRKVLPTEKVRGSRAKVSFLCGFDDFHDVLLLPIGPRFLLAGKEIERRFGLSKVNASGKSKMCRWLLGQEPLGVNVMVRCASEQFELYEACPI